MRRRFFGIEHASRRQNMPFLRALGVFLVVLGLVLIIISIPIEFWIAILGLLLAVIGFALLRFF